MTRIPRKQSNHLAGITAGTLMLSAFLSQPVAADPTDLFGSTELARSIAPKSGAASKGKVLIASSDVSSPEAGVQLIMRILELGGGPKIAEKLKRQAAMTPQIVADNQFASNSGSNFMNQAQFMPQAQSPVDPAIAIRPPATNERTKSKVASKALIPPPPMLALKQQGGGSYRGALDMISAHEEIYDSRAAAKGLQVHNNAKARVAAARFTYGQNGYAPVGGVAGEPTSASASHSGRGLAQLGRQANKLYGLTQALANAEQQVRKTEEAREDNVGDSQAVDKKVITITGPVRGSTVLSKLGQVTEYGGADLYSRTRSADDAVVAKDVEVAKPANTPASYPTTKEYPQQPVRRPGPVQIAYMPPSTVTGITGLRLGASEFQVSSFLNGKGPVAKKSVKGWKVWSLSDPESKKTTLQIYARNGVVEAVRIFDEDFVPEGLGINLSDDLKKVKEKFGEAIMLNEPSASGSKEYVYPVSQVSFQIARSSAKGCPAKTVKSMLLFQFL